MVKRYYLICFTQSTRRSMLFHSARKFQGIVRTSFLRTLTFELHDDLHDVMPFDFLETSAKHLHTQLGVSRWRQPVVKKSLAGLQAFLKLVQPTFVVEVVVDGEWVRGGKKVVSARGWCANEIRTYYYIVRKNKKRNTLRSFKDQISFWGSFSTVVFKATRSPPLTYFLSLYPSSSPSDFQSSPPAPSSTSE